MKSKSLVLMVVAMGCGLVAAYTTARLTAKNDDDERVLVANTEIKIGTVLKEPEKLFVEIPYKRGTAPNAVLDLDRMKDKVITRTVRAGQFIVPDDLSNNIGVVPPKGTKAMGIKVDLASVVGGFVLPGSRVDVMATVSDNHSGNNPKVIMVLQNQEVLSVDRTSVRPDGASSVETINTVTLAVTPQNALRLELALKQSGGVVRLLLRDQNDTDTVKVNSIDTLGESNFDFGSGGEGSVVRALAAKEDLKPGTVIDDPEKFFHSVAVAALPDRGYLDTDVSKLKGQTIHVPLFKGSFVTVKHIEE